MSRETATEARIRTHLSPPSDLKPEATRDISAALGKKDEARQAWQAAVDSAKRLEPDAQVSYIPDLVAKLKKL